MNPNEIIERYVYEVGTRLPAKGREDIQRELQSLVEDAVEARAKGKPPTVETVSAVLQEFGRPEKMAAQYRPTRFLIGPQLFPLYRTVVGAVMLAIAIAHIVLVAVQAWSGAPENLPLAAWGWLGNFFQSAFIALGWITIAFAVVERTTVESVNLLDEQAAWDPTELRAADDPDRVKRGSLAADIIFSIIALGVFIALILPDGLLAPFIADEFRPILGWLIASSVVTILLKTIVLGQNRWTPLSRWLEIGAEGFSAYVLFLVISGGEITTIAGLTLLLKFAFGIAFVVTLVGIVVKIGRLLWRHRFGSAWAWRRPLSPSQ